MLSFKTILITYKMFNLDDITTKDDNKNWPCRELIIGPSGSGEANCLLIVYKLFIKLFINCL